MNLRERMNCVYKAQTILKPMKMAISRKVWNNQCIHEEMLPHLAGSQGAAGDDCMGVELPCPR